MNEIFKMVSTDGDRSVVSEMVMSGENTLSVFLPCDHHFPPKWWNFSCDYRPLIST